VAVEKGEIPKVGPGRLQALLSFGIETAADVNQKAVLQVPGFGATFTEILVNWRTRQERNFIFDANKEISASEKQRIFDESFIARERLEMEIKRGLQSLEQLAQERKTQMDELYREAKKLQSRIDKEKGVIETRGVRRFSPVPLMLIAILVPLILFLASGVLGGTSWVRNERSEAPKIASEPMLEATPPEFSNDLDRCQRSTYSDDAEFCYEKGIELAQVRNFEEAEQFLLGAVRLAPMPQNLHELGYVQYMLASSGGEVGKYDESLGHLQKSVEAEASTLSNGGLIGRDTLELILKNYTARGGVNNALKYFEELSTRFSGSVEVQLAFGRLLNNVEDFEGAKSMLERALSRNGGDSMKALIQIELVKSYYELGFYELVEQQCSVVVKSSAALVAKNREVKSVCVGDA
jgi:tetratricopeptide (TPR) repeat protein